VELCRGQYPHWHINPPTLFESASEHELVLLVNGRWLAPAGKLPAPTRAEVGLVDEQVVYAVVPAAEIASLSPARLAWKLTEWRHALPTCEVGGHLLSYPWDVIAQQGVALEADYQQWWQAGVPEGRGLSLSGPAERCLVAHTAEVEPLVHIDTTSGPVLIDDGAVVQAFSRVQGPCYIGKGTRILGARINGGSIGPECRIGGEVEASIVQGYSNKAHEGFLGHSYVGEWVNLAAGTQTSDLRTDYGPIRMSVEGKPVETGLLKMGSFIGDHTKTSLNTLFNTGSQVGVFGQLLGGGELLPRIVPSFCRYARGKLHERNALRELFSAAAIVMARRNREWTETHTELFFTLFEETAAERRHLLGESELGRRRRVV
jgi:UDP-N-acetylglucosamine diphosphorylase/glucosamine-1-phosphate N-acetyltransferase